MKYIFLFPGQGCQSFKMLNLLDAYNIPYKDKIDIISNIVGKDIYKLLRTGNIKELSKVENSQLAMFAMNLAYYHVLCKLGIRPNVVVGHSLGQYNAFVASGIISVQEASEILLIRSNLTSEIEDKGKLVSVFSPLLDLNLISRFCKRIYQLTKNPISIALYNTKNQVVVGGTLQNIEIFKNKINMIKGYKCQDLIVPQAFHTILMKSMVDRYLLELKNYTFNKPNIPIILNTTGTYYDNDDLLLECVNQCIKPVLWTSIMKTINDVDDKKIIIEVGPGKTLTKFCKNNIRNSTLIASQDIKSIIKLKNHMYKM